MGEWERNGAHLETSPCIFLYLLSSHFLKLLIVCGSLAAAPKQTDLRRERVGCVEGTGLQTVRAAVRSKMNSMKAIVVDDDGEVERETR